MTGPWYASLVVNLRIRFDEVLTRDVSLDQPISAQGLAAANTAPSLTSHSNIPLFLKPDDSNQFSNVLNIVPKKASIELTGHRTAGKFRIVLDWKDFPFDPRLLRSIGVEIHLGSIDAADFKAGMRGERRSDGTLKSIIRTQDNTGASIAETFLLAGVSDENGVELTEHGAEVTIEGRDLRGVLLDSQIDPGTLRRVNVEGTIEHVVREIIALHPFGADMQVRLDPADWPNGVIPSPLNREVATRVMRTARGRGARHSPRGTGSGRVSFWDIITHYCYLVGAIPFFVGRELHVRPTQSIYDIQAAQRPTPSRPTPFRGGQLRTVDGTQITFRRLVYGRDLERLKFGRRYTGMRGKVIEVQGVDTSGRARGIDKVVIAQFPPRNHPARRTRVGPGGQRSSEEIVRIPVGGIRDPRQLATIARALYEEIARGEMAGQAQTNVLASQGGDNDDPDMTRLRPGDPIEVVIDTRALDRRAPLVNTFTDSFRRAFEQEVDELVRRYPDRNIAIALVATARAAVARVQRIFYVSGAEYAWDQASGIQITFDFRTYLEARISDIVAPRKPADRPLERTRRRGAPAPLPVPYPGERSRLP